MNQTDLIKVVRRNCQLEDTSVDYTDQIILDELNDAMTTAFERMVVDAKSGYWLQRYDYTLVTGQQEYRLPSRAIGLCKVELASANPSTSGFIRLPQISETDIMLFQSPASGRGQPRRFLTRADTVFIDPPPDNAGYTLRVWYYVRPSKLVQPQPNPPDSVTPSGFIASVNTTTGVVTMTAAVSVWNGTSMVPQTTNGAYVICDIVRLGSWHELSAVSQQFPLSTGLAQISNAGLTLTFSEPAYLSRVGVGDYVRSREQTDWPALPEDFHRTLADIASVKILLQRDFDQKARNYAESVSGDLTRFALLIANRVSEEPHVWRAELPSLRGGGGWGTW